MAVSQDLRAQVSKELDRNHHIALQKEVDIKQMQAKLVGRSPFSFIVHHSRSAIFRLRNSPLLAKVSSSQKLTSTTRIEDLVRSLEGNNEKLAVYERRPSRAGPHDISSADDLQKEVADLR